MKLIIKTVPIVLIIAISLSIVLITMDTTDLKSLTIIFPFLSNDLVNANNQFALDFYSQTSDGSDAENIFFSPISIYTAFAMVYEGAREDTKDEIQDVFHFQRGDNERRNSFSALITNFNENNVDYKLQLANALWLAENFKPLEEYVEIARDYYDSDVTTVDFSSDGTDLINDWINEKTEGKIKEIFASGPSEIQLAITNAVYFKGSWEEQFDKENTRTMDFHVDKDNTVKVQMMELKTTYLNLSKNNNSLALQLPYKGDELSMLILLPLEVDGIESLEESLSVNNLNKWTEEFQEMKTKVHLPKFQLETNYGLIESLQEMGIHNAFGDANLSGISNSELFIDQAIHKAVITVNEEGTEAAVATGVAMHQDGPVEFMADHPFIFIIQDNETGNILFMGKVMDPTK